MGRMPSGARIMGWRLCNIGFGVLLGPAVTHPTLRRRLLTAVDERRTGQEVLLAGDGRHHALRHEVEELPARSQPSVGQMALEYIQTAPLKVAPSFRRSFARQQRPRRLEL